QFKDVLDMAKESALTVDNKEKETDGISEKEDIAGREKGHVYSITTNDGAKIIMRIKTRGIKDIFVDKYVVKIAEETYMLKDKVGNNLLYFCVEGNIEGENIRVEENWSREIEVKVSKTHIATIKPSNDLSFKTIILIGAHIHEKSIYFAISVLMYFMYKIYKNESDFIENILFD